ncbi:MAG: MopE-related protein, partial [Myxococcota bacterium]
LLRVALCGNRSTFGAGGGVAVALGAATIRNCTWRVNRAASNGGGLLISSATVTLTNATFVDNATDGVGAAAVHQLGASATTSRNNLFAVNPPLAVGTLGGTRVGGYDLYWSNGTDATPETLPNDWLDLDPGLTVPDGCVAPIPADPGPAVDAGDPALSDPDGTRSDIGATGGPDAVRDRDLDGAIDGPDCDDTDPAVYPGATEVCDGVDDDCDGAIDDADPSLDPRDAVDGWVDADGDGFGDDATEPATACELPRGAVTVGGDCDDADPTTHPGAALRCGDDADCDGAIDPCDSDARALAPIGPAGGPPGIGCGCDTGRDATGGAVGGLGALVGLSWARRARRRGRSRRSG